VIWRLRDNARISVPNCLAQKIFVEIALAVNDSRFLRILEVERDYRDTIPPELHRRVLVKIQLAVPKV
jgi:hypothetical protein